MTPGTMLGAGQSAMSTSAALQSTDRNRTTVGARTTSLAALGFDHGISETMTLGATLSLSGTSLKNNAVDMDAGLGLAVWGQYSAGGTDHTGLQLGGAFGFTRSEGGRLLTDVITAAGQADVETRALHATVGYGLTGGKWLVTPELGLERYDTRRTAYTETVAAFNASYDAMETRRKVATLSMSGKMALGERGQLSLGIGVDREVDTERPRLTGRSDLPGLATFDIGSTFAANHMRAFATVGYAHDLGDGVTLSAELRGVRPSMARPFRSDWAWITGSAFDPSRSGGMNVPPHGRRVSLAGCACTGFQRASMCSASAINCCVRFPAGRVRPSARIDRTRAA